MRPRKEVLLIAALTVAAPSIPTGFAGGGFECEVFLDESAFAAAVAQQELVLAETEDFEPPISNLGPLEIALLADPLTSGVPNLDPESGLGFPAGLSGVLLTVQSNAVQQNAPSIAPGSGLAAVGPGFLDPPDGPPAGVAAGADVFAESTDVVVPFEADVMAIALRLEVAFHDAAELAVFVTSDDLAALSETIAVAPGQQVFAGILCTDTYLRRVNVGGPGGELIDEVELWRFETPACPWDCADGDGLVGTPDFLALLAQWGGEGTPCDFDGGGVGTTDFLQLLASWGPCTSAAR